MKCVEIHKSFIQVSLEAHRNCPSNRVDYPHFLRNIIYTDDSTFKFMASSVETTNMFRIISVLQNIKRFEMRQRTTTIIFIHSVSVKRNMYNMMKKKWWWTISKLGFSPQTFVKDTKKQIFYQPFNRGHSMYTSFELFVLRLWMINRHFCHL